MTSKRKRFVALVAATAALALAVTGCASKTDTGGTDGGATEATIIKIGIGAPLTQGAVALGKGMERGANLAISQANEDPAVMDLGITFESVSGDDQGDPKTGVTVANQFASDAKLIGVMGHLNSGVSIPASKVYNQNSIVMVSPASTNPALTQQGLDNVFRVCTIDSVQGPSAADSAYTELGLTSAFVVDDSTPYGTGLADEFAKQFEAVGGKMLGREKTGDKDSDFNALVTKIKSLNPAVVYYGGIYNSGALLSKQLSDAGVTAPLMGGDGMYDGEYIKLAGEASAEGDFCTSIGYPIDQLPKGADFKSAFEAAYPGDDIAAYDAYSFDATNVIIEAVKKVAADLGADKVTSPDGRAAVIAAVAATNMDGVSGAVAFDANGDTTNKVITLYTVKAGAWTAYVK
jgi:branched-chain amino acid transport system substrate-binding protein